MSEDKDLMGLVDLIESLNTSFVFTGYAYRDKPADIFILTNGANVSQAKILQCEAGKRPVLGVRQVDHLAGHYTVTRVIINYPDNREEQYLEQIEKLRSSPLFY